MTEPSPDTLEAIAGEVKVCTRCPLHRGRKNAVPGEGSGVSGIYFIGEGPGYHENEQGRPFVGSAGQLLTELLESIGLERRAVWITNVVRCRPPENRDPSPQEIEACDVYTKRQLTALAPKVIVTLGRHAMARFLPGEAISRVHGQPRRSGEYVVFPMYHPAAALHQPSLRQQLVDDFRKLSDFLERTPAPAAPPPKKEEPRPVTQPTLF
ncbi:MAG: uracil-DNA glycosylase [Chloroflexi bacterium 13_1_40CM_4_68_4]|nr:MAG: uracil-DNA glycosylase [Chloroflexi bacterium 13_1_40CM_4_68_4]